MGGSPKKPPKPSEVNASDSDGRNEDERQVVGDLRHLAGLTQLV